MPWTEAVAVRQAGRCLRCDYGKQCAANGSDAHKAASQEPVQ